MAQMQLLEIALNPLDVVYTPDWVARDVVSHFNPSGVCLDPCMGDGAFYKYLPAGSHWCEIEKGKDFFKWNCPVDWIVSNPPFNDYYKFFVHSFEVADNVLYVFPFHKIFQSYRNLELVFNYGGIPEIYILGRGRVVGWELGFAVGAVWFKRGYTGPTMYTFRVPPSNKRVQPSCHSAAGRERL